MDDILSQQEIDTLLSAISQGEIIAEQEEKEVQAQRVRRYDFRRPDKFSKSIINTLKLIYDNYARIMANKLSAHLRANVQFNVEAIDQVTYEEFIRSTPNPTLLMTLNMEPLKGSILFDINLQLAFQMIELLCGGEMSTPVKMRSLSEIEESIISGILGIFVENMPLAWADIIEVSPSLENIESNPQLNQTMSPTESVALVTFSIEIGETSGFANLCIPYLSVEKIVDKLNVRQWYQTYTQEQGADYRKVIEERLLNSKLDLSVLLGSTNITIRDFMDLSKGDVIRLDKKANQALNMYVEGKMHYRVQPGIYNDQISVQVIECLEGDVDINE